MPKRVLVVDDDPAHRRILEATIKRFGYHVTAADSGDEALSILKADTAGDIGLVLLDLIMPGTDGFSVLSALRALPRKPPVIVQTAYGSIDAAIAAMRAGAADFVVKPVSPERLEVSIKNALKIEALAGELVRIKAWPRERRCGSTVAAVPMLTASSPAICGSRYTSLFGPIGSSSASW